MESHKANKCKYLTCAQKLYLEMVTTEQQQERPSPISGGKRNLAEELGVCSEHARGSAKEGRKIRRERVADNLKSPHTTGPKAIFLEFALDKCIYKLLSNHGKSGIKFDQVVCLGHQVDDGVFYVGVSTCSMVCNVFEGFQQETKSNRKRRNGNMSE